jgi:OOP family OmpA-OmpF porin
MKNAMTARQDALTAKGQQNYPKEFAVADNDLKNATKEIESNDTSKAQAKHAALEASYREIEINSIKKEKLGVAKNTLEQATKEGAKKLTPETLTWAERQIASDEAAIVADRHNVDVVNRASADATATADRLLKMVRVAKSADAKNPEQIAKQLEKNEMALNKTGQNLTQAQIVLARTQDKLAGEAQKNEKLESQAWLDREYDAASAQFTKDEAEVYKQGNKLLLRLKGLSFANNKSDISSQNFPLLAKVQKVIGDVKSSQVVIEGHTDSTGAKKLNEELSTKRAAAVQSYLVANQTVSADQISSSGFGDSKPVATNKTAAGRAQNRRVDVIISADPITE